MPQHSQSFAFLTTMMMISKFVFSDEFSFGFPKEAIPVLAIHRQNTVLPCHFPVDDFEDKIIIIWQRVATKEVIFSSTSREDRQSRQYSGRASLFPEEFKLGNGSLKLEGVRPKDAGKYMCFIRTPIENITVIISLNFAAYYTEPKLIKNQTPDGTTFTVESQGFPKATVFWYNEKHQDISALCETVCELKEDGLYSLRSILQTNDTSGSSNYTVRLWNDVLQQNISRTFNHSLEIKPDFRRSRWMVLSSPGFIIIGLILASVYKTKCQRTIHQRHTSRHDGLNSL